MMRWLQENHITIYNIITTGAQQPQDTPEHNKLQARFLDKKFQEAFISIIEDAIVHTDSSDVRIVKNNDAPVEVSFEHGFDVGLKIEYNHIQNSNFCSTHTYKIRIEVKPHVGDDYPAVLRQMRINQPDSVWVEIDVLLIGKFESESINIDQLRGIFGRYKIVMLSDIEAKLASYT
jgi:hypothetical protein